MERVKKLNELYKLVIATLATILTTFLLEWLKQKMDDKLFATTLTIIIVTILVILLNFICENIFESSPSVRKLIFGDDFIEGYWYDVTYDEKSKSTKHGVLISISYKHGEFNVNGVSYDKKGNRVGTWKSVNSTYSHRVLFFQYEAYTNYEVEFIERGVNQLCFDNPASSYSGFYFDYENSFRHTISGDKVDGKEMKAYNNFKNSTDKSNFVVEKIKAFEAKMGL